jgi:acetoin utilization deacetylase AcuC-like enzyme
MCAGNPGIFTLSVHAANNFPARKQQSSLDVPLPDGLGDAEYLSVVAEVRAAQARGVVCIS